MVKMLTYNSQMCLEFELLTLQFRVYLMNQGLKKVPTQIKFTVTIARTLPLTNNLILYYAYLTLSEVLYVKYYYYLKDVWSGTE